MKALISKIEPRETGYRVAQVEPDDQTFPVAVDLFWADCVDNVVADQFWYDPADNTIKAIPAPPPAANQPVSNGAQKL
jgi:hypothetical protein